MDSKGRQIEVQQDAEIRVSNDYIMGEKYSHVTRLFELELQTDSMDSSDQWITLENNKYKKRLLDIMEKVSLNDRLFDNGVTEVYKAIADHFWVEDQMIHTSMNIFVKKEGNFIKEPSIRCNFFHGSSVGTCELKLKDAMMLMHFLSFRPLFDEKPIKIEDFSRIVTRYEVIKNGSTKTMAKEIKIFGHLYLRDDISQQTISKYALIKEHPWESSQ